MNPISIFVAEPHFCEEDDAPRRILSAAGFDVRENPQGRRLGRDQVIDLAAGADAVIAGMEPYDAGVLAALPRLRCISRCGVGTDSIDLAAAEKAGVAVRTTPDEVAEAVANLTVAMILALGFNFPAYAAEFPLGLRKKYMGVSLSGLTVGLVGYGRIGRAVESLLRPFKPKVVVADPRLTPQTAGVRVVPLDELLAVSDVVSIHAARRPEEGAVIGRREIEKMKPGVFIVNTARDHLMDEPALAAALKSGHVGGAGLDVIRPETYSSGLLNLPRVLCTPHIGTYTRQSRLAMETRCARNVIEFFQTRRPSLVSDGGPMVYEPYSKEGDLPK